MVHNLCWTIENECFLGKRLLGWDPTVGSVDLKSWASIVWEEFKSIKKVISENHRRRIFFGNSDSKNRIDLRKGKIWKWFWIDFKWFEMISKWFRWWRVSINMKISANLFNLSQFTFKMIWFNDCGCLDLSKLAVWGKVFATFRHKTSLRATRLEN